MTILIVSVLIKVGEGLGFSCSNCYLILNPEEGKPCETNALSSACHCALLLCDWHQKYLPPPDLRQYNFFYGRDFRGAWRQLILPAVTKT